MSLMTSVVQRGLSVKIFTTEVINSSEGSKLVDPFEDPSVGRKFTASEPFFDSFINLLERFRPKKGLCFEYFFFSNARNLGIYFLHY